MVNKQYSHKITIFQAKATPEEGVLVGYGALLNSLQLPMPFPEQLALISEKRRSYSTENWKVFSSRNAFEDTFYKHLVFALKHEGINLLFFKKLFEKLTTAEVVALLKIEPTGIYSRKIWFLYEWLQHEKLDIPDLTIKKAIPLVDEKLQYAIEGISSPRHRIINNLPGSVLFCPLIRKTEKLEHYILSDIGNQKSAYLKRMHKDVLQRASAYLLLKDSKASFTIEGEKPRNNRAARWGNAIGQAGVNPLTIDELTRLQQLVIESNRFTKMGIREQEGFVGDRDRETGEPIPDHISAKQEDLDSLLNGLFATKEILVNSKLDPVLVATKIAFGFVFIHPFVDGNGRLHRYIIHHILAKMHYSEQGMIFPVSASILSHITDYSKTLESYSHPVLEQILWKPSADKNVEILNNTIDYYRYFDATAQAEFLYDCVHDTMVTIIPAEVDYLRKYDEFKRYIDDTYEMPDNKVALLVLFLEQGEGILSKRAINKEFSALKESEVKDIESTYNEIFIAV